MTEKNTGTKYKDENDHPANDAPKDQGEIPRKRDDSKDDVDDPFDANKA
ncbi:hypothetical protein H4F33_14540 [Pectobacterium brasiliense]|uniref:Uncharacterized protein n=1 Tax=Pectobacterium brasiliense TaxID=180957 RepID=A0AAE2WDZ3_9GAMM|nr:hypothetical protein [Pectobacterium brasiliense]MBA0216791.1 hypothetical protein [Pectobacterium brasiliense]MBN3051659.1 hypothetical protein [Pectobacterium brasiliense]MBN3073298.1 hypothetical protein [Pectobacterium brasiliense]MBN3169171.1 hypothetical protein [Pectobacterium brasiliense]